MAKIVELSRGQKAAATRKANAKKAKAAATRAKNARKAAKIAKAA